MALQESKLYEAMFLVDTNIAADSEATKGMIQTIMDRAKTELIVSRLWDERRLAYDINKHKRATYILCYFRANGSAISRIERDVQLSEHLLRVLVLRADHISPEELEQIKDLPDRRSPASAAPPKRTAADLQTQSPKPQASTAVDAEPLPDEQAPADAVKTDDTPTGDVTTDDTPTGDSPTSDGSAEDETPPELEKDSTE